MIFRLYDLQTRRSEVHSDGCDVRGSTFSNGNTTDANRLLLLPITPPNPHLIYTVKTGLKRTHAFWSRWV